MNTHLPGRKGMARPRTQHQGQEERAVAAHLGSCKLVSLAVIQGAGGVRGRWAGCCPHRTLEREAKQVVGSLMETRLW